MASTETPSIVVENLVKKFAGVTAVNEVGFTVAKGEIIGFLGPNGAGKSTTMRILTGFIPATSGSVSVCGIDVARDPERVRRHIGYMPENNPLPEDMRVVEYLRLRGRLKEIPRRRLKSRLDEVLEVCDLKRAARRIIGTLSKGYRQRVGIADSILSEPDVIIMDEPTIGLDPHQIVMIRDLIAGLRGKMSILISSHILPEIEMTCDRVVIINGGRVVAANTPSNLRREFIPRTTYSAEIQGDPEGLDAALARAGLSDVTAVPPEEPVNGAFYPVTFTSDSESEIGEELTEALLAGKRYRVRSLRRLKPSLEEVFMAATRRSWDVLMPDEKEKPGRRGTPAGTTPITITNGS
jgi:ABC-2 type transport system ATP-binding protein